MCCAVMLFCSCGQEPPIAEPLKPVAGECILREGVWENDLLRLEITNEVLTAPLEELTLTFYNDSDYAVLVRYQHLSVEQLCDGAWNEVLTFNMIRDELVEPFCVEPHEAQNSYGLIFVEGGGTYHATYPPLAAGFYRLRIPCYQPDVQREVDIEFVVYFTVDPQL